ncbi:MAG: SDR family oxidoreductase [Mesorhizobium sp.]
MSRLSGKVAVITGGGRGLGQAMGLSFAAEGAHVAIFDIDPVTAEDTAARVREYGVEAHVEIGDLADRAVAQAAIDRVHARFGRIDVLVNNAMWIRYEPLPQIAEETVERMLGVGFKAAVWCMQGAVRHLGSGGVVINIASPAAEVGIGNALIYCGIKGAVAAMTRSAAVELGPRGIRAVAIAPGPIHTEGAGSVVDQKGYEMRLRKTPLGRLGIPDDVAKAAVFLASDDAAFINGDVIHVDGGATFAFL